jgi:glycine cleavage system H protein
MSHLKFTETHEWLRFEDDGTVVVGITGYAQEQLGDLVYVELPQVGRELAQGADAVVIESVKAAADIKFPLDGAVTEVNAALVDAPGKVNEDPMGAGWFFRLKPSRPGQEAGLMDEAAYEKFVQGLQ